MADEHRTWRRQDEGFWRAHHEAWKRSDLNQRQYCEAEGIPLKAFGNWRAQFKAEPQPSERKLLYRRRPLSPPLSPPISPLSSPVTYPSSRLASPIVPRVNRRDLVTPSKSIKSDTCSADRRRDPRRNTPSADMCSLKVARAILPLSSRMQTLVSLTETRTSKAQNG